MKAKVIWFRIFVIIFALSVIIRLTPLYSIVADPLRRSVAVFTVPVTHAINAIIDFGTTIRDIPTLAKENGALQAEITELKATNQKNQEAVQQNEIFRKELALNSANGKLVEAQIIARTGAITTQSIIIDKGSADGLGINMPVTAQGYLIGQINEADSHSSVVTLLSANSSLVPVLFQTSRFTGLLKGDSVGLAVDEIPKDTTIARGEGVVTSALGNAIYAGIPVGVVDSVDGSNSSIFQTARISSPVDLRKLEFVSVVKAQ